MDDKTFQELSPEAQELWRQTQQDIENLRRKNVPTYAPDVKSTPPTPGQQVAPLVKKLLPVTVVGRQPFPEHKKKNEHFIAQVPVPAESDKGFMDENKLVFGSFSEFYNFLKAHESLITEPEIKSFVSFMDQIPRQCGCVRQQLHGSAAAQYGHLLPIIHARNIAYFDLVKQAANTQRLVFKEKDVILLEV